MGEVGDESLIALGDASPDHAWLNQARSQVAEERRNSPEMR